MTPADKVMLDLDTLRTEMVQRESERRAEGNRLADEIDAVKRDLQALRLDMIATTVRLARATVVVKQ